MLGCAMGWLAIHRSDPQHIPVLPTRFSPADRRGTLISGGRGHPFAWPPAKDQCPDLLRDRAATRGPRTVGLWARRSVGRSPWSITASRSWGSPTAGPEDSVGQGGGHLGPGGAGSFVGEAAPGGAYRAAEAGPRRVGAGAQPASPRRPPPLFTPRAASGRRCSPAR